MYIGLLNSIKADHEADKKQLMAKNCPLSSSVLKKDTFVHARFFLKEKITLYERTFVWKVGVGTFIVNVTLTTTPQIKRGQK